MNRLGALGAGLGLALLHASAARAQSMPNVHAEDEAAHAGTVPLLERFHFTAASSQPPSAGSPQSMLPPAPPAVFTKVVFGYLPYWANDPTLIPWQHLTHLAYFAVDVNDDGSLGDDHGWSTGGAGLVAAGHAAGVRVVLTATLFDNTAIQTLLASSSAQSALIVNLLALVQSQGGDGVDIDFEFVPQASEAQFVTFMTNLTSSFHAAIPGSHVSLASPAINGGGYDYNQLAVNTDGLNIMGYDYHWPTSDPGPVSPIDAGTIWPGPYSLRWTTNDYLQNGGSTNRSKFILGLPLYGYRWPSVDATVPGTASGTATAVTLDNCTTSFAASGEQWDRESQTPYQVSTVTDSTTGTTTTEQLFCENEASLNAKLDLVNAVEFGGAMFWAIGYTSPDNPFWQSVDAHFTIQNEPPVAHIDAPAQVDVGHVIWLDGTGSSDSDGDALTYRWDAMRGPAVSLQGASTALAHATPTAVGAYVFQLTVGDGYVVNSAQVTVNVVAASSGGTTGSGSTAPAPPPVASGCAGCNATGPGIGWAGLVALVLLRHRRRLPLGQV